ncbi:MAG: hypothetical protein ACTSRP_07170 [Candidatus Helarchaeota archaeon]
MNENLELIKILCRQILLNKYIRMEELKRIFIDYSKKFKIKGNFKDIINEVRYRLENVGLNPKKITISDEDYVVITIPFNSQYIKKNRLDEINLSLLALIINMIESQGGKILQSELEAAFKKYSSRLKSFVSSNYLDLVDFPGDYEKYYVVTPLGLAIISDVKENLSEIVKSAKKM